MWVLISLIVAGGLGAVGLFLLIRSRAAEQAKAGERLSKREARLQLAELAPNPIDTEVSALLAEARSVMAGGSQQGELPSLEALAALRNHGAAVQIAVLRDAGRVEGAMRKAGVSLDPTLDALVHANHAVQDLYAVAARPRVGLIPSEITQRLRDVELAVAELKASTEQTATLIGKRREYLAHVAGLEGETRSEHAARAFAAGYTKS